MKKNAIIISILMIVLMSVLTVNCTKQDFFLSENVEQFSEWNIPDGISQFITQNFESYQSYLDMGGIPMDDLIEIINETTSDTGSNGDEHNTIHECISKYFNDTEAFHKCLAGVGPSPGYPNPPKEPGLPVVGPAEPGDENIITLYTYGDLEYFFDEGTDEWKIIRDLDYNVPKSINAVRNIFESRFPTVFKIAKEYYKNPKVGTLEPSPHDPSSCVHFWLEFSGDEQPKIRKGGCFEDGDVIPPFGDPKCFSEMLATARIMGLESSLYVNGVHYKVIAKEYYLLQNIAEMKSAFPIVYLSANGESDQEITPDQKIIIEDIN